MSIEDVYKEEEFIPYDNDLHNEILKENGDIDSVQNTTVSVTHDDLIYERIIDIKERLILNENEGNPDLVCGYLIELNYGILEAGSKIIPLIATPEFVDFLITILGVYSLKSPSAQVIRLLSNLLSSETVDFMDSLQERNVLDVVIHEILNTNYIPTIISSLHFINNYLDHIDSYSHVEPLIFCLNVAIHRVPDDVIFFSEVLYRIVSCTDFTDQFLPIIDTCYLLIDKNENCCSAVLWIINKILSKIPNTIEAIRESGVIGKVVDIITNGSISLTVDISKGLLLMFSRICLYDGEQYAKELFDILSQDFFISAIKSNIEIVKATAIESLTQFASIDRDFIFRFLCENDLFPQLINHNISLIEKRTSIMLISKLIEYFSDDIFPLVMENQFIPIYADILELDQREGFELIQNFLQSINKLFKSAQVYEKEEEFSEVINDATIVEKVEELELSDDIEIVNMASMFLNYVVPK